LEFDIFSEDPVIKKILELADSDSDVKAVVINGSRVNPNVIPDQHQDYDIAFYLTSEMLEKYKNDRAWIDDFGSLVLYQLNSFGENNYIFLIQYYDGLRLDICFVNIDEIQEEINEDSLTYVLLDKENRIEIDPVPSDKSYIIHSPSGSEFQYTTNELLWLQVYILKEIARNEMELAYSLYHEILVPEFRKLLSWLAGKRHNWEINVGKSGKWLKKFIPAHIYSQCLKIYVGNGKTGIIENIRLLSQLLLEFGTEISSGSTYQYPSEDHQRTYKYLDKFIAENNLE
jgi:aminoglycoside 6-adenylyltransferase